MHQSEQRRVGADQDVLAVVEIAAAGAHAPCPPARHGTRFEDGGCDAMLRERDCRRHPGVAGADDGYTPARTHVFQASQSLRSGVSEVRWLSTWKPSRSISASSVW